MSEETKLNRANASKAASKKASKKVTKKKVSSKKSAAKKATKKVASKATQPARQQSAFQLRVRDDKVGVIEINVPGEAQNTLKAEFAEQMDDVMDQVRRQAGLKGLVLISTKPGSFVAGADINLFDSIGSKQEVVELSKTCHRGFKAIEDLNIPVVAAIEGACLGGGLELAMACHYRVASSRSNTALGVPEVMLGLLPAGGGTQRLPRLVGIPAALDLMLTSRQLKPKQALKMGLIDQIVGSEALEERAVALALKSTAPRPAKSMELSQEALQELALEKNPVGRKVVFDQARKQAAKKTYGNYPAPERIIGAVEKGFSHGIEAGYEEEAQAFGDLAMSDVSKQLRGIFHATNALKKETFVADESVETRTIERVGVLGAGLMGAGIALNTVAKAKLPVRLKDRDAKGLSHGVGYVAKYYDKRAKLGAMSQFDAEAAKRQVTYTDQYTGFKRLDLVVEAVFEDLGLKHQMLKDTEANGNENTIFASNTSSIPISDIAKAAKRPENVIGLHYFSPVEKMPLLEIITTDKTAPEVTKGCVAFGKAQGKTVIVVKDGPGFYTTRILAPYLNEASRLLLEGVGPKELDKALQQFGYPVGPITLLDEVGIDVGTKVGPVLEAAFGERMQSPDAADRMIEKGFLGRKAGKGFYLYGDGVKGKPVNQEVFDAMNVTPWKNPDLVAAAERCTWMMINEAAFCLQEGIIQQPMHGDIGAIFGLGFPPFLGGPFRYMDSLGLQASVQKLETLAERHGEHFQPAQILVDMAKNNDTFYKN
ncbi:fatty acid oxidation complex alpha subunit [gamma proteobacterium HTCC5015]|nr:fatty acid oxidation complex alpha subunit [gamma proteobacterium HTCC5015]